jgi:hypothetical protein
MREIRCEHLDLCEAHRDVALERDPESPVRLRVAERRLVGRLLEDRRGGMALEQRRRGELDRGQRGEIARSRDGDGVASVDAGRSRVEADRGASLGARRPDGLAV